MKKKLLTLVLTCCFMLCITPFGVFADNDPTFTVKINNTAYANETSLETAITESTVALGDITSLEFTAGEVNATQLNYIKSKATSLTKLKTLTIENTVTVGALPLEFLKDNTTLQKVAIANATEIPAAAFLNCTSLTDIDFPNVTSVKSTAFMGCTALKKASLPKATTLEGAAFKDCTTLDDIDFPKLATINGEVFNGCTALKNITLPKVTNLTNGALPKSIETLSLNSILSINNEAFYEYTKLTSVTAPLATTIGAFAFKACTALTTVDFPKATAIDEQGFKDCTALTEVSFPEILTIKNAVFQGCTSLSGINFPKAETIEYSVFSNCPSLKTISLPKATTIRNNSFDSAALESITLDSIIEFESGTFSGCQKLISVTAPKLQTINSGVLSGCPKLTTVNLPELTYAVGGGYLSSLNSLKTINLPKLTIINNAMFSNCPVLESIYCDSVTTIGSGCIASLPELTTVSFHSVKTVQSGTMNNNPKLTTISVPALETLNSGSFYNNGTVELSLPNVTSISYSIYENPNLTTVIAPKLTTIIGYSFRKCPKLETLKFGATPPQLDISEGNARTAFTECAENLTFYPIGDDLKALANIPMNTAISAYLAVADEDTADKLWFGVKMPASPSIKTNPENMTIWQESIAVFTAEAEGYQVTYAWQVSTDKGATWTNIKDANTKTLLLVTALSMDQNQYRVIVNGVSPEAKSKAATLTVKDFKDLALPFTDINKSDWAYNDICYAYEKGLMNGLENNKFGSDVTSSRAMMVTMIYRMAGEPTVTGTSGFKDVVSGSWYENAVIWAKKVGLTKGYGNDYFGTDDPVTREQFATFLYRYAVYEGRYTSVSTNLVSGMKDGTSVSTFALDAMNWAMDRGIIKGMPDQTLMPQGSTTRDQMAAMIHRYSLLLS